MRGGDEQQLDDQMSDLREYKPTEAEVTRLKLARRERAPSGARFIVYEPLRV